MPGKTRQILEHKLPLEHGAVEVAGGLDVSQEEGLPHCRYKSLRPGGAKEKLDSYGDDGDDGIRDNNEYGDDGERTQV